MNGRERLTAILSRRPADRLAWTSLVDGNTLDSLPGGMKGMDGIEFYRRIGCDVLMLNGWGTKHDFASPALAWGDDVTRASRTEDSGHVEEWRSPAGTLTRVSRGGHPVTYPVRTADELRVYRSMWEGARYEPRDDRAAFDAIEALVGDDGVTTRFWGPSTIPRLLEYDMGLEGFYYLLNDNPAEMEDLIALVHEKEIEAFEMLARGPCDVVILVENTSTHYIGPEVYRRYNGPHVKDFVDIVHSAGKTAIIHMCGHVRNLLGLIRDTGLDGIHALTPPPTGDTPWETALDVLGEDLVIIGGLGPTVFARGPLDGIGRALDALYTPRMRRANVVLCTGADGITVPLERFEAVGAWMERNAKAARVV